jgi:VIT1/CCC1 family predicted Fe2+/Mn2+ transporter
MNDDGRPHTEQYLRNGNIMRNFIIGFSDGLTVPFALTAGLSSLGSPRLVVLAGLAELFSGAISMGLGAYLAATSDAKRYAVEEARERREILDCPLTEEREIYNMLSEYGPHRLDICTIVERLEEDPEMWLKVSHPIHSFVSS